MGSICAAWAISMSVSILLLSSVPYYKTWFTYYQQVFCHKKVCFSRYRSGLNVAQRSNKIYHKAIDRKSARRYDLEEKETNVS
ncbi:MAG: hypothetical protein JW971_07475, partial [Synergistales bacterium]|nr:hypothetical protein [Synergistales bacterium]